MPVYESPAVDGEDEDGDEEEEEEEDDDINDYNRPLSNYVDYLEATCLGATKVPKTTTAGAGERQAKVCLQAMEQVQFSS